MPEPTALPDIAHVNGEHAMLTEFLDYFRTVFLRKVEDLTDEQSRQRLPPSDLDLLGMTRHLADVERWWFRMVFTAETTVGNYESDDPDLDWHHGPADTIAEARDIWKVEVARAREIVAASTDLDTIGAHTSGSRGEISLRWIMIHMIEEYARHLGHADFLREHIDGATGD
ncbi:MAG: DinB family protein [Actinobacteria bacterium]|nr:DinB family protein [Actinomycetota bacterium]